MEQIIINALIGYCQRQGVLSTDSEELLEELTNITDLDKDYIEEFLN